MTESRPLKQLVLSLTGQCNFACRYCYAVDHSKAVMSAEIACTAVKLVRQQNGGQPFIIQFSGGEPLLNMEVLEDVVDFVEKNRVSCQLQIQTNAALLTESIANYLYQHKIGIGVSIDGRPAVNDLLRLTKAGKGATGKTLQGLNILRSLGIGCGLTCVVSAVNVEQLAGIIELAYYLGNVGVIGFDLLRGQGRGQSLKPANKEQLEQSLKKLWQRNEQLSKMFGYKIRLTQLEKARKQQKVTAQPFSHCHAMTGEAVFVNSEGKMYACASYVEDERFYIGSVHAGIDKARVAKVASLISESMSFCKQCESFKLCGGGCLARWYNRNFACCQSYEAECTLKLFFAKKA